MGRAPCCDKSKVKRGPWSPEEDEILKNYILQNHGSASNWIALPFKAGLKRCGKSCRLRWLNYLRPDIKHGSFTPEEDEIIFTLYTKLGSRWSVIASQLQGRTDNDVKNHWNTKLKKKLLATNYADNQQPYCSTNYNIIIDPQAASISTPSPAKLIPKIETYKPMFSTNLHGHDYYFDHQAMPSLVDVKNYKHNAMSSNTQEQGTSSVSEASQALATDNNFGTTMDFETEFYYDNIGIWNNQDDGQMIIGEAVNQNVISQFY